MASIQLQAQVRAVKNKGTNRRLRANDDRVLGIVYGAGQAPEPITIPHKEVMMALENEAVYSSILSLNVDGKAVQVVLKDLQRHPFKPRILHADFQRINANEKLTMSVPIHFLGEDVAPGVKEGGGIIAHLMMELTIKCLPANLPEYIEVDVSGLQLDHALHLSDVKLPKGVELAHPPVDARHDYPIITIQKPRAEEVATVAVAADAAATPEGAAAAAAPAAGAKADAKAAPAAKPEAAKAADKKK